MARRLTVCSQQGTDDGIEIGCQLVRRLLQAALDPPADHVDKAAGTIRAV